MSTAVLGSDARTCGCSGSSSQCTCGSCSSTGSGSVGSFSRPNFFAGQLLTDEDLRDAMDYFVQKNRLHNKHFMGEGVACGLRVDPHPCPDSRHKIVVQNGHAINGCGDDIFVAKSEEIDVLALVRQLNARIKGRFNCGDPCEDQPKDREKLIAKLIDARKEVDRQQSVLGPSENELNRLLDQLKSQRKELARLVKEHPDDGSQIAQLRGQIEEKENRVREASVNLEKHQQEIDIQEAIRDQLIERLEPVKYQLYVRYQESQAGFTSSYALDESSQPGCHGSRINEGYAFELRCHTPTSRPSLRSIIESCAKVIPKFESIQGKTLYGLSGIETADKVLVQFDELEETLKQNDHVFEDWADAKIVLQIKESPYLPVELKDEDLAVLKRLSVGSLRKKLKDKGTFKELILGKYSNANPFGHLDDNELERVQADEFLPQQIKKFSIVQLKNLDKPTLTDALSTSELAEHLLATIRGGYEVEQDLTDAIKSANKELDSRPAEPSPRWQRDVVRTSHAVQTLAFRLFQFLPRGQYSESTLDTVGNFCAALESSRDDLIGVSGQVNAVPKSLVEFLLDTRASQLKELVARSSDASTSDPATFDVRSRVVGEILSSRDLKEGSAIGNQTLSNAAGILVDLSGVNRELLGYHASGQVQLSPELLSLMFGVQLHLFDGDDNITNRATFQIIRQQANIVSRAVAEIARQCMCDATIPPCPDDSDTGVLLADVAVSSCEVVEICNLARRMVITGPSLRYWFSDFDSIFDGLRNSCCPSIDVLSDSMKTERERLDGLQVRWEKQVSGALESPFIPRWVADETDPSVDYLRRPRLWDHLHYETGSRGEVNRIAVAPTESAANLLEVLGSGRVDQSDLNRILAHLAGRPDSDLRNVLAWSEDFGSPAEVRELAIKAQQDAKLAKDLLVDETKENGSRDQAIASAVGGIDEKIGANSKLITDETKDGGGRDQAITAAVDGIDDRIEANTTLITDETKGGGGRDQAITAAVDGIDDRIEANTTLITDETKGGGGRDQAITAAVDGIDDKIEANSILITDETKDGGGRDQAIASVTDGLQEDLKIDHDGQSGTEKKLVSTVLEAFALKIRDTLSQSKPTTFLELRNLLGTIVDASDTDDDLKEINGIGPQAETKLRDAGISTFAELADTDLPTLQAIVTALVPAAKRNIERWSVEAKFAALGLLELYRELKESFESDGDGSS